MRLTPYRHTINFVGHWFEFLLIFVWKSIVWVFFPTWMWKFLGKSYAEGLKNECFMITRVNVLLTLCTCVGLCERGVCVFLLAFAHSNGRDKEGRREGSYNCTSFCFFFLFFANWIECSFHNWLCSKQLLGCIDFTTESFLPAFCPVEILFYSFFFFFEILFHG